ncbi:MAG: amino acid permease [Pseudomonadales bacterium]|nr:amino acid permease [Pseudomonadales bacterium]
MTSSSDFFSSRTAITLVVANMIGTGVFTSLGFQLLDIQSAPIILVLWFIGGVVALCGALCYAELGAALPRSGGEYNFLSRIYHPSAGFVSGWVSVTVGFSAPTAAAAITAATYFKSVFPETPVMPMGLGLVALIGALHFGSRRGSANFQQLFTSIKILLILVFIGAAWWQVGQLQSVVWVPRVEDFSLVGTGAFAVALIYVNYAYTGWNAATYLSGEVENPTQALPRILVIGTALVTVLYLLLHAMFLSVAPMSAMAGKAEIGFVVAGFAFGETGAKVVGVMLSILLISTVSAMLLAGPRALQVMGQDFRVFSWLAKETKSGVPAIAVGLQVAITLLLIITSSFESIIIFSGTILALNSLSTVLGLSVLRVREPNLPRPFRLPWYPLPLVVYAVIVSWTLVYLVIERPVEVLWALGLIALGLLVYVVSAKLESSTQ